MTVPELTKKFLEVVRTKNLVYYNDCRVFRPNAELKKIFNLPDSVDTSILYTDPNGFNFTTLQKYFTDKFATQNLYSAIGTYWEKGNQNEIDIVAVNDLEKTVLVAEVKRKKENVSIPLLQEKGKSLISQLEGYIFEYQGFSIDDM